MFAVSRNNLMPSSLVALRGPPCIAAQAVARSITRSRTAEMAWSKLWFGTIGTPWESAWLLTYRCSFRMFSKFCA